MQRKLDKLFTILMITCLSYHKHIMNTKLQEVP